MDLSGLIGKVKRLEKILNNTNEYRAAWHSDIKPMLLENLNSIIEQIGLKGEIEQKTEMDNLEAIVLDLGQQKSGISQIVSDDIKKSLIRQNGMLVYQQLFNGKIIILIVPPSIEGLGEPKPPRTLEILRPEELKSPFLIRHVEELLKEVTQWEDYDDDAPQAPTIGFNVGFHNKEIIKDAEGQEN